MTKPDLIDLRERIAAIEGRIHYDARLQLSDSPNKPNRPVLGPENISPTLSFGIGHLDGRFADGGIATNALHEVIGCETRGAGTASGFAMAIAVKLLEQRSGILLWTSDSFLRREIGTLNAEGLHQFGLDPAHVLIVSPNRSEDLLWVMEEALTSKAVQVVVGEFPHNHRKTSLTATRRLALKAKQHRTMILLVRHGTQVVSSAAQTQWIVKATTSGPIGGFEAGVGRPRWQVELDKNRNGQTGTFTLEWNHAECRFQDAAIPIDLAATPADRQDRAPEMGQVVALQHAS